MATERLIPGGRASAAAVLRPALLLATLIVAACGGDPTPLPRTALHLDPRLEGGVSPAAAFAAAERTVGEWKVSEDPTSLGPWRLVKGSLGSGGAQGGVRLRPLPDADGVPALVYDGAVGADRFNVVEVDLLVGRVPASALTWRQRESGVRGAQREQLRAQPELQTLRLSMVDQPRWRGTLEDLTLELTTVRAKPVDLVAIRHIRRGFEAGASPLAESGIDSGDGGVIDVGGEAYRAWPLPLDDPLVSLLRVPPKARLEFATAPTGAGLGAPLELRVTARPPGGGATQRLSTIPLGAHDGERRWTRTAVDLSGLAGRNLRLEFLVSPVGSQEVDLGDRAPALLGAPMVVGELSEERPPNVLLVTLDTTRFDALGSSFTGGERDPRVHTPFLDSLAAESLVFTDAWSAGNSTQPSHASILTGLAIQDHALFDNYGVLSPAANTLAEILRAEGYATAASITLEAVGASSGFAQGFDRMAPPLANSHLDGRHQVDMARAWIAEWNGDRPWFLWVHVYDPHTPYLLPEGALEAYVEASGVQPPPTRVDPPTLFEPDEYPADTAFLRGINNREHANFLYRAEVAYTDALMGSLFEALEAAGDGDRTLSVITADHGEHLGERSIFYSHQGLTPETLHVPLLLRLPGGGEGRYVAERVTTRDVVPTIVAALGIDRVPPTRDLVAIADRGADAQRVFWFEHANGYQVGCRDDRYHFVTTLREGFTLGVFERRVDGRTVLGQHPVPRGSSSLYDWRADPGLTRDLAAERPELVEAYLAALEEYRAAARPFERTARDLTAEQEEQLRNLGYTGD